MILGGGQSLAGGVVPVCDDFGTAGSAAVFSGVDFAGAGDAEDMTQGAAVVFFLWVCLLTPLFVPAEVLVLGVCTDGCVSCV